MSERLHEVESPTATETASQFAENAADQSVLIVSEHSNTMKIKRHWEPLADVANDVTMVCMHPDPDIESITYRTVPSPSHRLVGIAAIFFVAMYECLRGDYDSVASISLLPYGCFALVIGAVYRLPTHLGIIGIDLDRHATSWYGPPIRFLFRRFSAISVPGNAHARRLVRMGVPADRVHILSNAIDTERIEDAPSSGRKPYDIVWVGRFSPEKDPLLFVRGLAELRDRGVEFEAVMAGTGDLFDAVECERAANDLESSLSLPGWVDEPLEYYTRSRVYVLTSKRDALPLTLLDAMAIGLPVVVPDVGSVTDPVKHGETGFLVEEMTPETLADALETLLSDADLRDRLARNASHVRTAYSFEAAQDDWREILASLSRP